jgi:quinol monooxygenase YgiN
MDITFAMYAKRRLDMVKVALYVRLEAKPGKEADVEAFLRSGLALAEQEPATTVWFAIRMGKSTFGIFDAFPDEAGRQAHLLQRRLWPKLPNFSRNHRTSRKSMCLRPSSLNRILSGRDESVGSEKDSNCMV